MTIGPHLIATAILFRSFPIRRAVPIPLVIAAALVVIAMRLPAQAQVVAEVGPLISMTHAREGSIVPSLPRQGVGGATYGGTIGGGWIGDWGVLVEASIPKYLPFEQTSYMFETSGRLRDITSSGLVYIGHLRPMEIVIGVSHVRQDRESQNTELSRGSARVFPRTRRTTNLFAATGGIGIDARLSPRISVVPQLRVHIINRDDADFPLRLSSVVYQPGVVLRVRMSR